MHNADILGCDDVATMPRGTVVRLKSDTYNRWVIVGVICEEVSEVNHPVHGLIDVYRYSYRIRRVDGYSEYTHVVDPVEILGTVKPEAETATVAGVDGVSQTIPKSDSPEF